MIVEPHNQFSFSGNRTSWTYAGGVGSWFWMETDYRVLCDAGDVPTGGAQFASVAGQYKGSMSLGPTVDVQRKATSISIDQPASAVIGQSTDLSATTDAPDGTTLEFLVDGAVVGSRLVSAGAATINWTAAAPGSYEVRARVVESNTHAASTSSVVTAEVIKSDSTVSVSAATPAMAGSAVPLTATTTGIPDGQPVEFSVNGQKIGSADVADGTATYTSWKPATAGDYTIQARYAGSATVAESQSQQVGVTVIDPIQQTSTTLDVNPAPVPGQASTLTATVADGNDGDTVKFANNGQAIGAATLDGGTASLEWTPSHGQANQSYSLTAHYAGSTGYATSTSTPVTGTVGLVQTTISVVEAPATATVGEQVQLRATVIGGNAGEIIEFRDGDTVLETVSLSSGGAATAYWTPTAIGEYQVTAHYPGTSTTNLADSPSATTVNVQAGQSEIILTAPSPVSVGQATTLTADTTGIANGQRISFEVDGAEVGSDTVNGNQASFDWTPTATGEHQVKAVYAGSETVTGSGSNAVTVEVTETVTSTSAVTASADPETGEPVTFTATVTGGTEGVDVEFRDGATVLCIGELAAGGTATCQWTPDQIGAVQVTAHYPGDTTTSASQSTAATTIAVGQGTVADPSGLQVTPAAPTAADTITVSGTAPAGSVVSVYTFDMQHECTATTDSAGGFSCGLGTLPAGQHQIQAFATLNGVMSQQASIPVTVAAISTTIELNGPGSLQPEQAAVLTLATTGIADGEQLDILVNDVKHGAATVTSGAATYQWSSFDIGTFEIRATYAGSDSAEESQSNPLTIMVDETATQTSNVTAPTSGTIDQPVTLSATVDGGTEGVNVEFRNGPDVLCTDQLDADGTVSCDWVPAAAGTVTVRAHYPGDATTGASQSPSARSITVVQSKSTVSLTATSPVVVNDTVTFTVTTTGIADGQTVDITVDDVVVASPTVSGGTAAATWPAPGTAGSITATAAYAGTDTVAQSESDPVIIEVGVAATSTSDVAASSGATAGEPVRLSATVAGGTEGVEVEFRNGTEELCTGQVAAAGTVECNWTPATAGTVQVIAHYLGDATTGASQSGTATTITVADAPDTEAPAAPTGISIAPQPVSANWPVTVTGSAEPDSRVSVMLDGVEVCETTATGGVFSCSFTTREEMNGGQVTVTVTDAANNTSGAAEGGELQVQPEAVDPTAPTITVTPAQPVAGEPVEIEVTGDAGEEVVVTDGDDEICRITLDADGTATCEWTPAEGGQVVLTVTVGDQTVEKTVTVRPADDDDDGSGSLDMGSLGGLLGGAGGTGSSGSLGSLSSLGS